MKKSTLGTSNIPSEVVAISVSASVFRKACYTHIAEHLHFSGTVDVLYA